MQRIVGIDYGLRWIGIAVTDPTGSFALPLTRIERSKHYEGDVKNICKEIENIQSFVVGLPLYLTGKESDMSKLVREFGSILEKITNKPVIFFDERLTSKQAEHLLRETTMNRKKRTTVVDIVSALLILQSYLDSCNK